MLRIFVWFLILVAAELAIALFMLGSWLIEGRRRAEEIDRLTELWRSAPSTSAVPDPPDASGSRQVEEVVRPEPATRSTS
jgi:hypothetical protein